MKRSYTRCTEKVSSVNFNDAIGKSIDFLVNEIMSFDSEYKGQEKDKQITKELEKELITDPILKGMAISTDLINKGEASLMGRSIKNVKEMAAVAQAFRDPRYETIRYVLTKDDEIVSHLAVTSKMPSIALIVPGKRGEVEATDWLDGKMKEYGANGYYLIHNHPSGDPNPSTQDLNVTGILQKKVNGYKGHIIINSGKYASLGTFDEFGEIKKKIENLNGEYDELLKPSLEHPLLGKLIDSPSTLANISKDLQNTDKYFTIIGTDTKLKTRTILEAPMDMINNTPKARKAFEEFLKTHTRETGSNRYFVSGIPNNASTIKFLANAEHHKIILDATFNDNQVLSEINTKVVPDESFSDLPKEEIEGYLTEEKTVTIEKPEETKPPKEGAISKPWSVSMDQYAWLTEGVMKPGAGLDPSVSFHQLSQMSEREKKNRADTRIEEKTKERERYNAATSEWEKGVWEAYLAGRFNLNNDVFDTDAFYVLNKKIGEQGILMLSPFKLSQKEEAERENFLSDIDSKVRKQRGTATEKPEGVAMEAVQIDFNSALGKPIGVLTEQIEYYAIKSELEESARIEKRQR